MDLPKFELTISSDGTINFKSKDGQGIRADIATNMVMHCSKYLEKVKKKIGHDKKFKVKLVYSGGKKKNRVVVDAEDNPDLTVFDVNVITEAFMKCLNELPDH